MKEFQTERETRHTHIDKEREKEGEKKEFLIFYLLFHSPNGHSLGQAKAKGRDSIWVSPVSDRGPKTRAIPFFFPGAPAGLELEQLWLKLVPMRDADIVGCDLTHSASTSAPVI